MKRFLTRLMPARIRDLRLRNAYAKRSSRYAGMETEQVFAQIYSGNEWKNAESVSGAGSTLVVTESLLPHLQMLFADLDLKHVLDVPCGDFHWLQHLDWGKIRYTGGDIVPELVAQNLHKYGNADRQFVSLDLIRDPLPAADLLLVRDCMVHLSFSHIQAALENIRRSEITYLLATHFPKLTLNFDIHDGDWRPINLQLPPFNLPAPIQTLPEFCPPGYAHQHRGKCLALWRVGKI